MGVESCLVHVVCAGCRRHLPSNQGNGGNQHSSFEANCIILITECVEHNMIVEMLDW